MMPYDTGRPSFPARADDDALPPVASQIGSRPATGRGTTARSSMAGRTVPDQVTLSVALSLMVISRSSFSA